MPRAMTTPAHRTMRVGLVSGVAAAMLVTFAAPLTFPWVVEPL